MQQSEWHIGDPECQCGYEVDDTEQKSTGTEEKSVSLMLLHCQKYDTKLKEALKAVAPVSNLFNSNDIMIFDLKIIELCHNWEWML